MRKKLGHKFWITMMILSLIGQVAWVVENMYLNVFVYNMFHASAADISLMVGASAITATLTTLLIGAWSDKVGKRKVFICSGYIAWGISILSFALIRMDLIQGVARSITEAATLGVSLVIVMDCIMTFFGSAANDAGFNAWLTDVGNDTNRGRIEGINSMMPLVAILLVFGSFMFFDLKQQKSWTIIFVLIGCSVLLIGVLNIFLMNDVPNIAKENQHYIKNLLYSFRPSVYKENRLLYQTVFAFAIFGISIQIFMPYLILYYEVTLGLKNYVIILAPAIVLASVITAFYGKLFDMVGFKMSVVPTILILSAGYLMLFFFTNTILVFLGSLFMMTGYLTGTAIFGAMIREHIPKGKAGLFQGLRIFGQVFVPGIVGPAIGAFVLRNADKIKNQDGTFSFIPNQRIYLAAFIMAAILLIFLDGIFIMIRLSHYHLPTTLGEKCEKKWEKGELPWQAYPRPQMKRKSFFSLNGEWEMNHEPIRVPFSPQADLSGNVRHGVLYMSYTKHFTLPKHFVEERVLLHFGAVDQVCEVMVNDHLVGKHEGGYLPFSFDVTNYLNPEGEDNKLKVRVIDLLRETYPYGKQRTNRGGMWYTPVTGIWQSVWMESVPQDFIEAIKMTPDLSGVAIEIKKTADIPVYITIPIDGDTITKTCYGSEIYINLQKELKELGGEDKLQYWTPDHPHLYTIRLNMGEDSIDSYFALRTIEIKEIAGIKRICLNDEPIFLHGVLDQGYYSDGIYTPACEKSYEEDILAMKKMGFNTLRKHIKVEAEAFYYACDRLGMLVMQDMVNSGHYSFLRDTALPTLGKLHQNDKYFKGSKKRKEFFIQHSIDTVNTLYNHPCIVYYTIFNEGWGQFNTDEMYHLIKHTDTTRIIDTTSGWFKMNHSDVESLHLYYANRNIQSSEKKPIVISECGGYSLIVPGHFYSKYNHYGYGNCDSAEEMTEKIVRMYKEMVLPAIKKGVCGSVYTQLSDVEDETNGLLTYDRKIEKVCQTPLLEISRLLQEYIKSEVFASLTR